MTQDRWVRVKQVLQQAWDCDPAERGQVLDLACADDPELRAQVEALLASDDNNGEFLSQPAVEHARGTEFADDDLTADPGRRIGPYRVIREIGHGGMGTVYLAERADGQYRKRVAIKLVNPHLGTDSVLRRFRNERQVLAALDHPNIASLLDGGVTEDGLPYLVMEYVDGVRIDTWCDSRKLPVRDRLRQFRKVCDAVQCAHEQQIVHRDIKPGNILVAADGTPQLLDFGIAKLLNPELCAETLETTVGAGPMTPEYASPEQIRGEPVGPASDIYSLGVVLYHLLTGRLPYSFPVQDFGQVARVICEQKPVRPSAAIGAAETRGESPTGLRRLLAGDLDNIVLKALRKEPERRYSSAAQLSEDLHRFLQDLPVHARKESPAYRCGKFLKRNRALVMTATVSSVVVLALAVGVGRLRGPAGTGDAGVRSIAVLPLENLSGDKEQEYFADGITDALIGDLARIPALRVISRTSVMSYKDAHKPLPEIARRLGVQTIAEGSVLRAGNHVRITVRLIDALQDRPVWTGNYEGQMSDVLRLQSQVAEAIAVEIHVTLTRRNQTGGTRDQRVNLDAYDAYLKGRHQYFSGYTKESTEKAIAWFRQSLDLDPGFALAYAGLADCYWGLSNVYYAPTDVMPKAKWAALKAIELDDTLGEAHGLLGRVRSAYDFNRAEAAKEFQRALELKPGDAQVHLLHGIYLAEMGRFDAAVAELEQAQKLDPVSPFVNAYVGAPLFYARRYDQIIQRMQPLIEMDPSNQAAHAFLALALEQKGELAKATTEMERAYELDQDQDGLAQLGHMYAVSGRTADARKTLRQLQEMSRRRYVSAYNLGVLYTGLGERDQAFRWLQKVEEDRSEWFAAVNVDPRLDALHSDPRFAVILRSVGLAQ
jgi:eukaryotic-like serine/threonine-protein kinase